MRQYQGWVVTRFSKPSFPASDTCKTRHYYHKIKKARQYVKGKGKAVSFHAKKAYRGNKSTAPLILKTQR